MRFSVYWLAILGALIGLLLAFVIIPHQYLSITTVLAAIFIGLVIASVVAFVSDCVCQRKQIILGPEVIEDQQPLL